MSEAATAPPSSTPAAPAPPMLNKAETNGADESTPLSDSMAELESLDSPEPQQRKPFKKAEKVEKVEPPVKPEKTEKAEVKTAPEHEEKVPQKASELKAVYEKTKATLKEREAELAKVKAERESQAKVPVEDPEKKSLAEKVAHYEKQLKEFKDRNELVDYKNSEEFQSKYWKPYQSAVNRAVKDLDDLTYSDTDGNQQKVDSNLILWLAGQRPAQAEKMAKQLFGEAGLDRLVTDRIDRIRDAADQMNEAESEHKKSAEERLKQQETQSLEFRKKITKLWMDENNSWSEKFPNWFKPKDGDEQGNALLTKGYELADKAFSANGKVPPEEMVKIHAEVRHKAAAFPRLALRLKQSRERIAELEKQLAEYESSEPPAGTGRGVAPKADSDVWGDAMAEIDSLDKKR